MAGRLIRADAIIDTGNRLKDPYNGKPVSIIDRKLIPKDIDIGEQEKMHYIPMSSVGCGNGVIQVFTAEKCRIYNRNMDINIDNILIGISENILSHGGGYNMLVNPLLIKSSDKHNKIEN